MYRCKQCGWHRGTSAHWVHAPIVLAITIASNIKWALKWIPHTFNTRVKHVWCVGWDHESEQWYVNCSHCFNEFDKYELTFQ